MKDIAQTQNKVLESDEFVLSETRKIQYTYGLKHEMRYIVEREEDVLSESVAEHVYALHLLADYFLPLEDPEQKLDWQKVHNMLQYHDIDEIETGDTIGYLKTDKQRILEAEAAIRVVGNFPNDMKVKVTAIIEEYETQETVEARLSKALDRLEPLFQLYNHNGKQILKLQKTTKKQSRQLKESYVKDFPCMYRFFLVIEQTMEKEGFFHE